MQQNDYIKGLLKPNGKKAAGRKVWSVDLETVWLPFFTATNTMGDTRISPEALGAPLRLGYNADGTVKFSLTGKPVIRVVKDLADSVKLVRDNFTAGLMAYASEVFQDNEESYKAQIGLAQIAGKPIVDKDRTNLEQALAEAFAAQVEQAAQAAPQAAQAAPQAEQAAPQAEQIEQIDKPKTKVKVTV